MKKILFLIITLIILIIFSLHDKGLSFFTLDSILYTGTDNTILKSMRIPSVLLAFVAGGVLSVSGAVFQSIFRNPIASPYTLGVASGASLGASIYLSFSAVSSNFFYFTPLFAFIGATLSVMFIYSISKILKSFNSTTMILSGVVINFLFSSIVLLLQYISDYTDTVKILFWTMGGINPIGYTGVIFLSIVATLSLTYIFMKRRELDILLAGEEFSKSRGVNSSSVKKRLFFAVSLMIGVCISFTGPIGFVGIIAPHIARSLTGITFDKLIFSSFIVGGLLLVVCSDIARNIIYPAHLPVGIITAVLGGPFFLFLLIRQKK